MDCDKHLSITYRYGVFIIMVVMVFCTLEKMIFVIVGDMTHSIRHYMTILFGYIAF